ncbi:hypothetical protein [Cryobacterium sp. Y62]|uniref:hypothetical protein n=1 Tax=Cryobacterium sp. Y62 TaxID=2048284 RepID=UPI000CE4A603|nr:hypothetical protein [Cryobacterium sp. Y62]
MFESDLDFAAFMATRNVAKVRKERFTERIEVSLAREYDHDTQKNLLLIRAQAKVSMGKSTT